MKNQSAVTQNQTSKISGIKLSHSCQLSDDAFYLIALATLLMKLIKPFTVQQFLSLRSAVTFNSDVMN